MKHTPGPWKIGEQYLGCRDIFAPAPGDEPTIEICSTSGLPEEEDDIANANLIAAAPDLLNTLEWTLEQLNTLTTDAYSKGDDRMIRNRLQETIDKARGQG